MFKQPQEDPKTSRSEDIQLTEIKLTEYTEKGRIEIQINEVVRKAERGYVGAQDEIEIVKHQEVLTFRLHLGFVKIERVMKLDLETDMKTAEWNFRWFPFLVKFRKLKGQG